MRKFEVGKTYQGRYIGDHKLKEFYTIIKRTEKTVTIQGENLKTPVTRKITIWNDCETFHPEGKHSPIIKAENELKEEKKMDAKKTTTTKKAPAKKTTRKTSKKNIAQDVCQQLCFCFEVKPQPVYFKDVKTMKDLKESYKALATIHHPDKGGDIATMAAINAEYDEKVKELAKKEAPAKHTTDAADGMTDEEIAAAIAEEFKATLEKLMTLDLEGVKVELIGSWLWVSGNTKPIKDELKALKFRWCPKKDGQPWTWHDSYTYYPSSKGRMTKEDVENKYGVEELKSV